MEFDALAAIGRDDLLRLADLVEAGLLTPPFGDLALRNYVADVHAASIAQCLNGFARQTMVSTHVAWLLRAFAAGQHASSDASTSVEVVISGPDLEGKTRDTGVVIRQLFSNARHNVLAVGFAVHQGKSLFKILADRLDRDPSFQATLCIDVRRAHGETSLSQAIVRRFANQFACDEWPGDRMPRVYYDPRSLEHTGRTTSALHAKCVVIDGREALVTSANFTEAAQQRNIELGLRVTSGGIPQRIEEHFTSLIQSRNLERLPLPRP